MGLLNSLSSIVGNKKDTPPPDPSAPPLKKILIVEDDKYLREFYAELLTSEKYAVSTAENGQVGLLTLVSDNPDLVLLDLMMPVMDGKEMLHNMRQRPEFKETPVIVLTNAGDADSIRETKFFDNANEFLIKSNINPEVLLQRIKSFM